MNTTCDVLKNEWMPTALGLEKISKKSRLAILVCGRSLVDWVGRAEHERYGTASAKPPSEEWN